ncbi:translation initiation factor IF-2 [Runella salmonicolor]|uniref:Translation initiation factor IF-2 n=2 Tax=Runella salmonicolor TaxID=2950278 RepID=A0ABT1FIR3_9BACT|nr:translation initiation factor IF-2 [Runella salmonicolor]MCP1381395.1 translation initiation factor IF-2 [Runella salmonicolor]
MSEEKSMRLSQAARILNRSHAAVASILGAKGFKVDNNPNTKLNAEQLEFLSKEFKVDALLGGITPKKEEPAAPQPKSEDSPVLYFRTSQSAVNAPKPVVSEPQPEKEEKLPETPSIGLKVVGKIDLDAPKPINVPVPTPPKPEEAPKLAPPVVEEKKPEVVIIEEKKPELVVEEKKIEETPVAEKPVEEKKPEVTMPEPVKEVALPVVEPKAEVILPVEAAPVPEIKPIEELPKAEPKVEPIIEPKAEVVQEPAVELKPAPQPKPKEEPAKPQPFTPRTERPQQPVKVKQPEPPKEVPAPEPEPEPVLIEAKGETLKGLTILGKIELPTERRGGDGGNRDKDKDKKRKRKRLRKGEKVTDNAPAANPNSPANKGKQNQNDRPITQYQHGQRDGSKTNAPANATPSANATPNTTAPNANTAGGAAKKGPATNNANTNTNKKGGNGRRERKDEISDKEVADSIKATYARLSGTTSGKNFGADKRRERRRLRADAAEERMMQEQEDAKVLKVTEFISANELSSLMDVSVQEVISVCLSMGMFVSINQRLDAESITLIADEFGYEVEFISAEEEIQGDVKVEVDAEEDLLERAPIVTIMGHVDHGKTSLLDYIRRTRVAAGEAGGITQHIGAYSVKTDGGRRIAFLDTPGHEAFTAMRARGAKLTDVVIIVIAADDSIMPQTREAINHAQNANVPIVFAFSKIDKPGANTEKIREALANMNILVEEWGGKYQTQEISSKSGVGIPDLMEKVLLEADLLELKANPNRRASGTVVEASLDKGRGYVATILVQTGTLRVGDVILAGAHFGRVRAMFDATGARLKEAGPSTPVQLLGLNGAPQAGDKFNVMENEREAREIANKREQIMREQTIRTRKHITLEEIGRRKAIGTFKELNIIVKGDVDGSVEALSDSLLKLSTEEVQVNIINKAVGQIAESDINLAIASDAIIVGFQVRPSNNAKKLAEQEQIEIRLYSVIYDAINEVKDAMAGMLEPTMEEAIVGNAEVREVFKISKIGTVAGSYVTDGIIKRNNKVRVIRDFIVVHEGDISQLKRYKDDVNEVKSGFEFGLSIRGFNDLQVGDIVESFEMKEVKRTL